MFSVELVISGYLQGVFPMADEDGEILWYSPDPRAVIPLNSYKPSKSLRPILNRKVFEVKVNQDFESVIRNCAIPRGDDDGVWISEDIVQVYLTLHNLGYAHSVEAWYNGELAGGLYGVALGSVFFGESMYHTMPNASKVAFHYLVQHLKERNFGLLDTQFINDNVKRFGAIEISREDFMKLHEENISLEKSFI